MPMIQASLAEQRLLRIAVRVFIKGDTTTIRAILGFASACWAVMLWLPLGTFDRSPFMDMKAVAPDWLWGILFMAHFLGVLWRFIDVVPRMGAGFAINAYGLIVWITSSGLVTTAVGEMTPGLALEWTVIVAAAIALYRTGMNDEVVSP